MLKIAKRFQNKSKLLQKRENCQKKGKDREIIANNYRLQTTRNKSNVSKEELFCILATNVELQVTLIVVGHSCKF